MYIYIFLLLTKCPLNLKGKYVLSYRHSSLLFTFPLNYSYSQIIRVEECHNSSNNVKPHNCRLSTWLINCLLNGIAVHPDSAWKRSSENCMKLTSAEYKVQDS